MKTTRFTAMLHTTSILLLGLAAIVPLASAGDCNFTNNGIIIANGDVGNEDCGNDTTNNVSYIQYCDQGTGAGAGAAGVGVGPGADGSAGDAAAGASTNCQQWASTDN